MKRRLFALTLLSSLPIAATHVAAQETPAENRQYYTLQTRQPTLNPSQIEVLEFFTYSCEHCNAFESIVDPWRKKLPRDVVFRRIPVAFREDFVFHQKLYYAIEALGLVEQLHHKVFSVIHGERKRLNTVEQIRVFAATQGVDPNQFIQTMESFSVMTKVKQANALVKGYAIEGTPSIGVNGRWLTSGSMAGSHSRSLDVAEYLIGLARKG